MLPNLIVPQDYLNNGIIALYKWDNTIFDNLKLPDSVDKSLFINTLFHRCGHTALDHPDPEYMKFFIGVWSDLNLPIWKKLEATLNLEYNPIHNYDRTEEEHTAGESNRDITVNTDTTTTRKETGTGSSDQTSTFHDDTETQDTVEVDTSGNVELTVSAENSDVYQPDNNTSNLEHKKTQGTKNVTADQTTDDTSSYSNQVNHNDTENLQGKTDNDETHSDFRTMRAYGNIGVTTTQEMIKQEREIVQFNLCEYIVESFKHEFCLYVY